MANRSGSLEKILDLWDRWEALATHPAPARREGEGAALPSRRDRLEAIRGRILVEVEDDGASSLGSLRRDIGLGGDEILIVLALLRQMLSDSTPYLKGRQILNLLFRGSYEVLRAARHLEPHAPLRVHRVIEAAPDAPPAGHPLEGEFRLTDEFFARVRRDADPTSPDIPAPRGYSDNLEYLLDLRCLSHLYRRRAVHLFRGEEWEDVPPVPRELQRAMEETCHRISERLGRTENRGSFPAIRFQEKYRLEWEQMVIVVTLLFQDLFTGSGCIDTVDLLKLVSEDERDLVEKRRLLAEGGGLLGNEILTVEEGGGAPDIGGEAALSSWAADAILGEGWEFQGIDADSKLDFHEYLERIDDSSDFFRKLRLPPQSEA